MDNFLINAPIIKNNPRKLTTEGPHEKSNAYEKVSPAMAAAIPNMYAIHNRERHVLANRAEKVAGIISMLKITSTPAIRTAMVITSPMVA